MRPLVASLLLLAGGLGACLVPQPYEEAGDDGPTNDPPHILGREPQGSVVRTQRGCREVKLELLAIEDLDVDDALEVRWFVNYEQGRQEPVARRTIPAGFGFQYGIRTPAGDSLQLSFDRHRDPVLVVEAVVSDGFDPDPERQPMRRAILPGKAVAETSWAVFVEDVQECLP